MLGRGIFLAGLGPFAFWAFEGGGLELAESRAAPEPGLQFGDTHDQSADLLCLRFGLRMLGQD
jgi:hypothetical protein